MGDLVVDPDAIEAFGGEQAISALPSERGIKPVEFIDVSSPRTGKTMRAVCRSIVASQTVDLSGLKVGEVPRVSILSLKLDVADVPFRLLIGCLQKSSVLRSLIVKVGTDSVEVRHPSGRTVEIAVVAGSRAAGSLVARWSAGLIADEGTRMMGDEAVASLPEALSAIRERLLPGAQIQIIGQPHAPFGPAYEIFQEYFGHPTDETVAMRTTGPAGNPQHWNRERLRKLRKRDPSAADVAEFARFLSPESNLFSSTALDAATRKNLELPAGCSFYAAMDPATRGNSWTLIIVARKPTTPPRFAVAVACQWTGSKAQPLDPELIVAEIAGIVQPFGIRTIISDQWLIDSIVSYARKHGLQVEKRDPSMAEKVALYETLRLEIEAGRFELPDVQQLRDDLLHVKKKVTQTGITIELPHTADGRHCDFCPAIKLSFEAAMNGGTRSLAGARWGTSSILGADFFGSGRGFG